MHGAKILPALSAAWSSPISASRARARAAGPSLPAFLEAQLLDGFIGDGSRNAYAASLFDGRMAVNGAFLFDDHMAVNRAFLFDGHMAVNGAFVFGGRMAVSGAFIPMRKGEPAFFWGFVIVPIKMDALGRPFRALCKMCGNAAMKSYSTLP